MRQMMRMRRNDYWQNRIQEQKDKSYKRLVRDTEKALSALYTEQAEELRKEVLDVLSKIQHDKGTNEGILATDLYRSKRYWTLLDEINKRLKNLGQGQIKITSPAIISAYEETQKLIDDEIPDGVIKPSFLVPNAVDANQVINQVWCLDGKNFSQRVWNDKNKLITQLKKSLADSLVRGKSNWEVAVAMADKLNVSRENAYRLVRTETAHAQNYAQTQRYKEYGFTRGKFLASPECCDECKEHNGEEHTLEELEKMLPVHPRCRCSYTLITD